MRRSVVLACVLLAVLAIGIYVWKRPARAPAEATAPDDAKLASTPGQTPSLPVESADDGGVAATADADPRERGTPQPDAPYINPPAIQSRMTDAHAHLQDVAKPCLALTQKKLGAHVQFRFGYTLTYKNGQARVNDLSVVWSDLDVSAVEKCLVEKLAGATWSVSEPDWTNTVEDALVGPDLE